MWHSRNQLLSELPQFAVRRDDEDDEDDETRQDLTILIPDG